MSEKASPQPSDGAARARGGNVTGKNKAGSMLDLFL